MGCEYSDVEHETEEHALPDIEVFELTACEVAEMDHDRVYEYSKRYEFRLCHMNSKVRERMIDAIVEEQGIEGGWFWQSCFPGRLPNSDPVGPFKSYREALKNSREIE